MNTDILKKLPKSWEEITLKKAIDYLNVEFELPVEDEVESLQKSLNNIYRTIAVLTGINEEEVRRFPKYILDEATKTLAFMGEKPKPKKESKIEWKEVNEITYDNFITYTQLQGDSIDNMPKIIESFSKNKLTEEEILNLNMVEVHTAFFLLLKKLKKFIRRTQLSLGLRVMKQSIKTIYKKILIRKK